ncbi:MAG TPA: hypothetical protein VJB90_00825 [Candidatus Nanoarchaeia archaeon]|nr:hypothetical protein [Candidatus Nanoarchaeia archaeon]
METTIKIRKETKSQLDLFRESKSESYDDVLNKVMFIAKKTVSEPNLSRKTMLAIEAARERIKQGNFLTEAEAKKRLGL